MKIPTGQSLAKVSQLSDFTSAAKHNVAAIIADGNNLFTLQGVHLYPGLIQVWKFEGTDFPAS